MVSYLRFREFRRSAVDGTRHRRALYRGLLLLVNGLIEYSFLRVWLFTHTQMRSSDVYFTRSKPIRNCADLQTQVLVSLNSSKKRQRRPTHQPANARKVPHVLSRPNLCSCYAASKATEWNKHHYIPLHCFAKIQLRIAMEHIRWITCVVPRWSSPSTN